MIPITYIISIMAYHIHIIYHVKFVYDMIHHQARGRVVGTRARSQNTLAPRTEGEGHGTHGPWDSGVAIFD